MSFLSDRSIQEALPAGVIFPYAGSTAPDGWLLCNDTPISRTTYARLFAAIGTTYGVGDGVSTFNLPNAQGVFLRGAGSQTISSITYSATRGAAQIDSTKRPNSSFTTDTLGSHQHSVLQNARWSVGADAHAGRTITTGLGYGSSNLSTTTVNNGTSTDGSHAHAVNGGGDAETRPANVCVNYIIKI